ncbi:MAG: PAS domain-containing protein [Planctomycetes bacterium]|nr:PAS domain-containing protein [Planctomycetota bacterium]
MTPEVLDPKAFDAHSARVLLDRDGRVQHVSPSALDILGASGDPKGRPLHACLSARVHDLRGLERALQNRTAWCAELPCATGSGVSPLQAVLVPVLSHQGEEQFLVLLSRGEAKLHDEASVGDVLEFWDHAPLALHSLDLNGRIILVNDTWLDWLGYAREEVEGVLRFTDVVTPESATAFERNFPAFQSDGFVSDLEYEFRRKDGSTFPGLLSATAVRDSSGRIVRTRTAFLDISGRRRAEQDAKALRDRLTDCMQCIPNPIGVFDAADRFVYGNQALLEVMGHDEPQLLGKTFEALTDGLLAENLKDLEGESAADWKHRRMEYHRNPVGSFEDCVLRGRTYRVTDRRTRDGGTVVVLSDRSDDARHAAEVEAARIAATAANRAKNEFLSSMSHELRTPLNSVLGFAQLLERDRDPQLTPRQLTWVSHVLRGGEHLLQLIDEILDLARIESGSFVFERSPIDVPGVLRDVMTMLEALARTRGVTIELAALPPDLGSIEVDRKRLTQILLHLGSNAVKYNRQGGKAVIRAAMTERGWLRIAVRDDGPGIPLARRDALFIAFQRLGQEAGPIPGTGIGLTMTKLLTELMGGRVGFETEEGHGSTFWIEFPAHAATPQSPSPPVQHCAMAVAASLLHILYIEDNPTAVDLMKAVLTESDGFRLSVATTAETGLQIARASHPDLVLLDLNLPGMSGHEAFVRLRSMPETRMIPVLAISAAAAPRDVQRALDAGFAGYVTKPLDVADVVVRIRALAKRTTPQTC